MDELTNRDRTGGEAAAGPESGCGQEITDAAEAVQEPLKAGGEIRADGSYSWVDPGRKDPGADHRQTVNPWGDEAAAEGASYWKSSSSRPQGEDGAQAGSEQQAYRAQTGSEQQPFGAQAGGKRQAYDAQQGKEQQAFTGPAGNRQQAYAGQPVRERQNFTEQPKNSSPGRRWAILVAMALVFGLITGLTAFGVNRIGNFFYPPAGGQSSPASAPETEAPSGTRTVPPADTVPEEGNAGGSEEQQPAAGPEESVQEPGQELSTEPAQTPASPVPEMSVADVTANCMPSMVTISTMSVMEMQSFFGGSQKYTAKGAGTGIIVGQNDDELLIATNNHVVEGASQLSVGFIDEAAAEAAVKGADREADLAVIAVKLEDISDDTMEQIRVAVIGDSDALRLGDQIVVIGNALGYGQSVTSGYISAFDRELNLSDGTNSFISSNLIQVDAAINSGNSGGALLNMRGELVGINEAKSSVTMSGATVDNMGYAIPINKAEPILEELIDEAGRVRYSEEDQGYLGVTCANVTAEYSRMYGMPEGVCFTSVVEGGPAAEAGIRKGDVLVSMDGKAIKTYQALTDRLTFYRPGDTVTVVVLRTENDQDYEEYTCTVTLGARDVLEEILGTTPEDE